MFTSLGAQHSNSTNDLLDLPFHDLTEVRDDNLVSNQVVIRREPSAVPLERSQILCRQWRGEKLAISFYHPSSGSRQMPAPLEATRVSHQRAGNPRDSMRGLVTVTLDGAIFTLSESRTGTLRLTEIHVEGVCLPSNADVLIYRALRERLFPNGTRSRMRSDHALEEAVEDLFADTAELNLKKRTWLIAGGETP